MSTTEELLKEAEKWMCTVPTHTLYADTRCAWKKLSMIVHKLREEWERQMPRAEDAYADIERLKKRVEALEARSYRTPQASPRTAGQSHAQGPGRVRRHPRPDRRLATR